MSFEFLTIVRNGKNNTIYRLAMEDELKEEMARNFTIPAGKWLDPALQRTAFDEMYSLSDAEIFEIKKFIPPDDLLNAMRFPQEYSEFNPATQGVADIKAIAAVSAKGSDITAIFKAISKTKKLEPAKNLMLVCTRRGYVRQTDPCLTIDDKIVAVYEGGSLFFRSPSSVKKIMSLKDYMKEANDLEMVSFLESKFETNTEKILAVADTWMRKRFASLMESKLFEERTPLDIYDTAKSFSSELPIELSKDRTKLILPEEKQHIRMILKFLNEEYYKGMLTGKDYQTSSRRPLAGNENKKQRMAARN